MRKRLRALLETDNPEGMERAGKAWLKRDPLTAQNARIAAEEFDMDWWVDLGNA